MIRVGVAKIRQTEGTCEGCSKRMFCPRRTRLSFSSTAGSLVLSLILCADCRLQLARQLEETV